MQTDYIKQADDFLTKHDLKFSAVLIGNDCPKFCEDAAKHKDMDLVDRFPRRSHIHGKHYRCIFTKPDTTPGYNSAARGALDKHLIIDFWNSYADEEYNAAFYNLNCPNSLFSKYKKEIEQRKRDRQRLPVEQRRTVAKIPTPYDVLACITKSDPGTFDDFCSEYGYDNDSIKAMKVWEAVVDEWHRVVMFFTPDELDEIQEIQ